VARPFLDAMADVVAAMAKEGDAGRSQRPIRLESDVLDVRISRRLLGIDILLNDLLPGYGGALGIDRDVGGRARLNATGGSPRLAPFRRAPSTSRSW
jgi:hypothetical protein